VDIPDPKSLGSHDVILKIAAVGICGSDVHYWSHGRCGPFIMKAPLILGHETSAQVVAIGSKVKNLKPGDRVGMEPGIPCRMCRHCRGGNYNLCPDITFLATPPYGGSLTQYVTHAADFCFKIPQSMSYEEAALLEPISVGIQACRRAGIKPGSVVLITGLGPVGLVSMLVAKISGAIKLIGVDMNEERLKVAKKFGADVVFSPREDKLIEKLKEYDITEVIECSGADQAISLAIHACAPGGKVVLIGRGAKSEQTIPLFDAADKELTLLGSFRYHDTYPTAVELVASGMLKVKDLVTHRFHFTLKDVQEAFEIAETSKDGAIKVMIHVNDFAHV